MKKSIAVIGVLVSLMPMGQSLVIGSSAAFMSAAVILSVSEKVQAESASYYATIGYMKWKDGNYYEAILNYSKAIEINPRYPGAYSFRADARRKSGDHYGAIADFSKLIEMNPKDDFAYYNRGNVKTHLKDYDGAIADYSKAIEISPFFIDAYKSRSIVKEQIFDIKGACLDAKKMVTLGDRDYENKQWIRKNCL